MRTTRMMGTICSVGSKFYIFGGMETQLKVNSLIEVYSAETESFLPSFELLNEKVVCKGCIFIY
jgi:hypothetical protein